MSSEEDEIRGSVVRDWHSPSQAGTGDTETWELHRAPPHRLGAGACPHSPHCLPLEALASLPEALAFFPQHLDEGRALLSSPRQAHREGAFPTQRPRPALLPTPSTFSISACSRRASASLAADCFSCKATGPRCKEPRWDWRCPVSLQGAARPAGAREAGTQASLGAGTTPSSSAHLSGVFTGVTDLVELLPGRVSLGLHLRQLCLGEKRQWEHLGGGSWRTPRDQCGL